MARLPPFPLSVCSPVIYQPLSARQASVNKITQALTASWWQETDRNTNTRRVSAAAAGAGRGGAWAEAWWESRGRGGHRRGAAA